MSEQINHECGIAFLRLLKPLEFYHEKYGTPFYGINKMYLLMEKQHNRGQDGAGIASIKFDMPPGTKYADRLRSQETNPIQDIFKKITSGYAHLYKEKEKTKDNILVDSGWLKNNIPFTGELLLGHLRYGTYGGNTTDSCHPFIRRDNWKTKTLLLAGNFNMTNNTELFDFLVEDLGMSPAEKRDTITILEKVGHHLHLENERLFHVFKKEGYPNKEISSLIARDLNITNILSKSAQNWDGGYVISGLIGHGDGFVMRDPSGIRPAFYYYDDEIVVATSERPVIQTVFNVQLEDVKELKHGHALIVKRDGRISEELFIQQREKRSCSFERIYFSRGSDADIYKERKKLGQLLVKPILDTIKFDFANTVFSFIPNTAESCYRGLVQGIIESNKDYKTKKIMALGADITAEKVKQILSVYPRAEITTIKDAKLRTFITQDTDRDDLVAHVYDVTYGVIRKGTDTLVIIDDSIVRGTTLKKSILKILGRLEPKKIIVVSSAPQIRYPDCYGIDMAKLGDFIAFQATIELLKETKHENVISAVYKKCKAQENLPKEEIINHVKDIYRPFSAEEISKKIAQLVTPPNIKSEVMMIYQTIEGLHEACPNHLGDWYFTGDYPTPGGNKVVNKSFINYIEGNNVRAY